MKGAFNDNPSIVTLGGGTGLATLLSGLKRHTSDLTAIVTVADDGGSSGRLRRELGVLPPGDIRSCLVALADDGSLMRRLFEYRFEDGDLAGHSFGNLLLTALSQVTDDFEEAIDVSGKMLGAQGTVVPATLDTVSLTAELSDGKILQGQSRIDGTAGFCRKVSLEPAAAQPTERALTAISGADLIAIGPGSLFTSIMPNLLIADMVAALMNTKCRRVFVCNVMTQPGETLGFSAADHLEALQRHAGKGIVDTILVNTAAPPPEIVAAYAREQAQPVEVDEVRLNELGVKVLKADVGFAAGDYFRHDDDRLGVAVMSLLGAQSGN